jgi:hypothetical protein
MNDQTINKKKPIDLDKEQSDLILLMESSMTPELLDAVQQAYRTNDDADTQESLDISYEGTRYA